MKREEAIDIIQAVKFIDDFEDYSDRLEIALEVAIEVLKERLEIDYETMRADFGEVELRGIKKIGGEANEIQSH